MIQLCTYQLHISLNCAITIRVGRLGCFLFPAGNYIYTGSAKRNMAARIRRHLLKRKTKRWHIDYLLVRPEATIIHVDYSPASECGLNQDTLGEITAPGFGASDCRAGCGSHLKFVTPDA